jgi:hypothetical protein
MRVFAQVISGFLAGFLLIGCGSSSLPSAESLSASARVLREQARPEFDELERRRAVGLLSEADYQADRAALEKRISDDARDAAWSHHFLVESERRANGEPTPDAPQSIMAPNALRGGAGGAGVASGGSLYRPYTQQSQGMANSSGGGMLPSMGDMNNSATSFVPTAPQ